MTRVSEESRKLAKKIAVDDNKSIPDIWDEAIKEYYVKKKDKKGERLYAFKPF